MSAPVPMRAHKASPYEWFGALCDGLPACMRCLWLMWLARRNIVRSSANPARPSCLTEPESREQVPCPALQLTTESPWHTTLSLKMPSGHAGDVLQATNDLPSCCRRQRPDLALRGHQGHRGPHAIPHSQQTPMHKVRFFSYTGP